MQENDEKLIKGKGTYNFPECPPDSTEKSSSISEVCIIPEDSESTPLSRNERPLGGKGKYRMPPEETPSCSSSQPDPSEEAPEETGEEETGPIEKRIESKIWKTRAKAYEELCAELIANTQMFEVYSSSVVRFISDSHPGAQEKAMDVLQVYLAHKSSILFPHSENLVKTLIEKCVASTKASTKASASTMMLDFFAEHKENFEGFIQGLLQALNNKNIKVQTAAIFTINSAMAAFGVRHIPFKPFLGAMEKFAGNSNPVVRGEALNFYKECYRWVRDLILPSVNKLKKPQQDELHKAFEEITESPCPTRHLKHEESKERSEGEKPRNRPIDVYEMADARDIFTRFNDKWADSVLEMEKWTEKKLALELLNTEANYPKIAEKSPAILVAMAKRLINDANVNVMLQALKMIGLLAKGQRKYFEQYAKQFFPIFLSKLKDKKTQIIQETYLGLENLLFSVNLEQVNEDIKESMEDKTPTLKVNVTIWLQKIYGSLSVEILGKNAKNIAWMARKNTDDSIAEVRNESFKLISVMLKRFPEAVNQVIKDFPPPKLKKLEEISENKDPPEEEEKKAPAIPQPVQKLVEKSAERAEKPAQKTEKPVPKKEAPKKETHAKGAEEDLGMLITPEEAEEIISPLLLPGTLSKLKESSWKDKLEGLQEVMQWVNASEGKISDISEALFMFIKLTVKDWKENNVNLTKMAFEIMKTVSELATISKRAACAALTPAALEKLSEAKLIDCYTSCLLSLSEAIGPRFVVGQIIKSTSDSNKPKVVSECLSIICRIIADFGVHKIVLKEVIDYAKLGLNQANPVIKKSAQALTVKIYSYIGDNLLPLLGDIKEATLKALQEDFSKTQIENSISFKSVRGEEELKSDATKLLDDLIPRVNISSKITAQLLKDLSDSNWKTRKDSLESIEDLLDKSGKRILPTGLEDLFKSLKSKLEDSNKSIVRSTLTLLAKLAESLGAEASAYSRVVVPGLLASLADKQSLLRQDALATIDKWAAEAGAESIISCAATPLMQDNPELRTELLNWLLAHKESLGKCELKFMAPCILSCLQDRTANIRNAAELLYGEVVEHTGFDCFQPLLNDVKPAVISTLKPVFAKYRRGEAEAEVPTASAAQKTKHKPLIRKAAAKGPIEAETKTPRGKTGSFDARLVDAGDKEKRLDLDSRYKWSVEEIRPDYLEKLREQIRAAFAPDLCALLLHADFKKKADAAGRLVELVKAQDCEMLGYLDLLLKWGWIELIHSSNTQIYKAVLELDLLIFARLEGIGYQMTEVEAGLVLPVLCDKSGQNNAVFRTMIRKLLHQACKIHPVEKVFAIVLNGVNSKNARSKFECIEELGALIVDYGIEIVSAKDIKFISKQVNSVDNNVRSAAVVTLGEVFKIVGEKIWNLIGDVPDKVRGILDQRFRSVKVKGGEGNVNIAEICGGKLEIGKKEEVKQRPYEGGRKMSKESTRIGGSRKNSKGHGTNTNVHIKITDVHGKETEAYRKNSDVTEKTREFPGKNSGFLGISNEFPGKPTVTPSRAMDLHSKVGDMHNKGVNMVGKASESIAKIPNFQSIADKLSSLEKVQIFDEDDKVISEKLHNFHGELGLNKLGRLDGDENYSPKSGAGTSSIWKKIDGTDDSLLNPIKTEEITVDEEIAIMKEENKQRKPIHELRDALKIRKLENLRSFTPMPERKITLDMPAPVQIPEILAAIQKLENSDVSFQLDALEFLNSNVLENLEVFEEDLFKYSHDLLKVILYHMSSFNHHQYSLEFFVYFFKVVHKLCSIEFIVKSYNENELSQLSEAFLRSLILEGLEKTGENNQGEVLMKTITASVMKILEFANPTEIFVVFLRLLVKYKSQNIAKMNGILIRCVLKLTKGLGDILDDLNLEKLLLGIQEYLVANNSVTEEMGIKAMKTILNELVKLIGDDIWTHFNQIRAFICEESQIEEWIHLLLGTAPVMLLSPSVPTILHSHANSLSGGMPLSSSGSHSNSHTNSYTNLSIIPNDHLSGIFHRLTAPEFYPHALKELHEIIEKDPLLDISSELSKLSRGLNEKITADLLELKKIHKTEPSQRYNFSEMQSRLAMMKQKYGFDSQQATPTADLHVKTNSSDNKADVTNFFALKSRIQKFSKK